MTSMVACTGTGLPSFMPGLNSPFLDRFNGLLIQAQGPGIAAL